MKALSLSKNSVRVSVCQRECERGSETDFYSPPPPSQSSGHCVFKVHVSLLSDNVLLLSY